MKTVKSNSTLENLLDSALSTFLKSDKAPTKLVATPAISAKFVKGETYKARRIGDADAVLFWEVQKVTARRVTVLCLETNQAATVGIKADRDGAEYCFPEGQHSMALQIRAANISF